MNLDFISEAIKKWVSVLFFFIAICWLSVGMMLFTNGVFFERNENYTSTGLSAFMGAFAAFLLLIVQSIFAKILKRHRRHRNALVKLELLLNHSCVVLGANIFTTEMLIEAVKSKEIAFIGSQPKLMFDYEILYDLKNTVISNVIFGVFLSLESMNYDLATMRQSYGQLTQPYLDKKLTSEQLNIALKGIERDTTVLLGHLKRVEKETEEAVGMIRALMQKKSFLNWLTEITIFPEKEPENFAELIKQQTQEFRQEREVNRNKVEKKSS